MYQKDKRIKRPVNSCMTVLLIIFLGPSILSLPFGFIFATYDAFKKGNIFQGFLLLAVTTAVFYGAYKLYLIYRGKDKVINRLLHLTIVKKSSFQNTTFDTAQCFW